MGPWKMLFFCAFTKLCMRSQKWNRQAVPFLGPCLGSFLQSFLQQGWRSAMFWCQQKLCGLWRPERQLGRPFWAKPVLRRFSGPRIGSVGASCFVDDFVPCWGKRDAYPLLLEPGGSWLLIIWFRLVAWLFAAKRRPHQPFAALGDCLRCFLLLRSLRVFAQVAGFHLDDCWPPLPL